MTALRIVFAYPGDLAAPTGGYGYDRRVIAELQRLGARVAQVSLPASFPSPSPADIETAERLLTDTASDALIIDGLAFGALPPDVAARLRPRPIALVHHPLFLETGLAPETAARLRAGEHAALAHAAAIVTTSRMTSDIVARAFGVAADRLFVAEPGVEPAARSHGSNDGTVRLIAVGSVLPRKGYDDLVRALAGVTGEWRLAIVGSLDLAPDCAHALRHLIGDLGLSARISLEGALSATQVADRYAGADAFVTSSHFEGYGMAVAEAVARGLPIVVTQETAAAGAAPAEAVLTFPAGDISGLRAALTRIIGDPALREKLGARAWAAAAAQMRWRETAQRVLRAIDFAMAGGA